MAGSASAAISDASGAVSSLFQGFASEAKAGMYRTQAQADLLKRQGDLLEADNYTRAGVLAQQNKAFTEESTAIQVAQADRAQYRAVGAGTAAAGASGVAGSGSALDVLADSARQGALQKQVLEKQGVITEAGYQEQYDTYQNMVKAANLAADSETLAHDAHLQAADAEDTAATGNFISGGIKGIAAVAQVAMMLA